MVYLSRAVEDEVFLFFSSAKPLRPSSPELASFEPPQSMTKAWQPRTLIARLFVLLNTVAIMGKSSFLIVLKSRIGSMFGRPLNAASTRDGVEDSMAVRSIGRTSSD